MGTTLVSVVFCGNRVSIGHIGDSRCYRLRGEKLEQLTHDHSLLQEQIDGGQLTRSRHAIR
jgi:protein phosphatase